MDGKENDEKFSDLYNATHSSEVRLRLHPNRKSCIASSGGETLNLMVQTSASSSRYGASPIFSEGFHT